MSDQVVSNQVLLDFSNRKLLSPVPKKLYESAKVYFSTKDLELLQTAYNVAFEAHKNQFRKEGSAYITHPVEVASILIELHLDIEAVRSHGRVWKYKGTSKVDGKRMADAEWSATIVDRK